MDRNFDGLSDRFNQQIYGTFKGQLRLRMLDLDFQTHLGELEHPPLSVLGMGGGMGQFSSWLALANHNVTLVDPSQHMLSEAQVIFKEIAPKATAEFICSSIQHCEGSVNAQYDLVLNHAVLEWLEEPEKGVQRLCNWVKPGGALSLMFYTRHAIVWRNLVNGSWQRAHARHFHHEKNALMPQNPLDPEVVYSWLRQAGFDILCWRGIRCVHDHMPKTMRACKTLDDFVEIESEVGLMPPYRDLRRYVHLLARKRTSIL